MLTFARFLLFIIGIVELGQGHWVTSYDGLQSIIEWSLFIGSFGLISISFTAKNLGRTRSSCWAFCCSLVFLAQLTWCGFIGFLVAILAITIISFTPDKNFLEDINWYDDGDDY